MPLRRCLERIATRKEPAGSFLSAKCRSSRTAASRKKRQSQKSSREKRKAEYDRYDEAKLEYFKAKEDYDELRSRHGREAKLRPIWYIPALGLIGVFEALINFDSFNAIKMFTPAIALGVTFIVALALATASHLHGTVIPAA